MGLFFIFVVILGVVFGGPFFITNNELAQAFFGILTTAISTGFGVYASWKYSKNSDQERLTRYGLLAWRNIDALSLKVQQQMHVGSAGQSVMESWLLDIDQAKWAWRDLLRQLFELQQRLEIEQEELSIKYKNKIDAADNDDDRERLKEQLLIETTKIRSKAPLPISKKELIACPNCHKDIVAVLGEGVGQTAWPICEHCGAKFPIHRVSTVGDIVVNSQTMKLPVERECPKCKMALTWRVSPEKNVHFRYVCPYCAEELQCDGNANDFSVVMMVVE